MTSAAGRVVARVYSPEVSADALRRLGWQIDDLGLDFLIPVRDFSSLEEAREVAEGELPAGSAIDWHDQNDRDGGFIIGHPGLGPGIGGPLPALVIWPLSRAGVEEMARSWEELARLLAEHLDELVDLARIAPSRWHPDLDRDWEEGDIQEGYERCRSAIERLPKKKRLSRDIHGPFHHVACSAHIEPVHRLRWSGFSDGWCEPARVTGHGKHPILAEDPMMPDYDGEAHRIYAAAERDGAKARRRAARAAPLPRVATRASPRAGLEIKGT